MNLSEEEIEEAKQELNKFCKYDDNLFLQDEKLYVYQDSIETLLKYIEQLEQENKQYREFIIATSGKDIENITATKYMQIKREGYIEGRIEERDKLIKHINKLNKMIDEMAKQLDKLQEEKLQYTFCFIAQEYSNINDCARKTSCVECIKRYFKEKVEKVNDK